MRWSALLFVGLVAAPMLLAFAIRFRREAER